MAKKPPILTAIDLGSSTFRVALAEGRTHRPPRLLGLGRVPGRGIRRGEIVSVELASEALRAAVEEAEVSAGLELSRAFVGISGQHLRSVESRGHSSYRRRREIGDREVEEVLDAAASIPLASDREVVGRLARGFFVDGGARRPDPRDATGSSLEAEAHLVTGAKERIRALVDTVDRVGIEVAQLVFSPLAAARAALGEEERRKGTLLIDLGAGVTELVLYREGGPCHSGVLPIGGNHFTNDLAMVLETPFERAEGLKIDRGACLAGALPEIDPTSGGDTDPPDSALVDILRPRAEELLQLADRRLRAQGWDGVVPGGLVLVGGGVTLRGFGRLAERMLSARARVGGSESSGLLGDPGLDPKLDCTLAGLLLEAAERSQEASRRSLWGRLSDRLTGWGGRAQATAVEPSPVSRPQGPAVEAPGVAASPRGGEVREPVPVEPETVEGAASETSPEPPARSREHAKELASTPAGVPPPAPSATGWRTVEETLRHTLADLPGTAASIPPTLEVLEDLALEIYRGESDHGDLRSLARSRERWRIVEALWHAAEPWGEWRQASLAKGGVSAFPLVRGDGGGEDDDSWPVAFRERSVADFFVARRIATLLTGSSRRAGELLAEEPLNDVMVRQVAALLSSGAHQGYRSALRWLAEESRRLGKGRRRGPWLGRNAVTLLLRTTGELPGHDWSNMVLDGADLSAADLSGKSFYGASLRQADLRGALLRDADLRQSDLSGARLDRHPAAEGARIEGLEGEPERRLFEGVVGLPGPRPPTSER